MAKRTPRTRSGSRAAAKRFYCILGGGYRGSNFSEKLENYVLDTEERREQLVLDWNRLQAEIQDKRRDLETIRSRIRKISQVDQRFDSLVSALLELVDS